MRSQWNRFAHRGGCRKSHPGNSVQVPLLPHSPCGRKGMLKLVTGKYQIVNHNWKPELSSGILYQFVVTLSIFACFSSSSPSFPFLDHTWKPELSPGILYQVMIHFALSSWRLFLCCLLVFFFVITPGNPSLAQGFYTRLWCFS